MFLAGKKVLSVFLEKDNIKLIVSKASGSRATRVYAGRIEFNPAILHDSFIVDSLKFSSQLRIALQQKRELQEYQEVQIVMPPEKTYLKTFTALEGIEPFLKILPYFKEELILQSLAFGKGPDSLVAHLAFERKLVEDLQQPFLEAGKKIVGIVGSAPVLYRKFYSVKDYFLFLLFEKSLAVIVCQSGRALQLETWTREVFAQRFVEFVRNNHYESIKEALSVGVLDNTDRERLGADLGLVISLASNEDIYDLVINAALYRPSLHLFSVVGSSDRRFLPAAGVGLIVLGMSVLAWSLLQRPFWEPKDVVKPIEEVQTKPEPQVFGETVEESREVEAKPEDFKVRLLNGTKVTGEAGRLGKELEDVGFQVLETKNASNSAFVETKLRAASAVPEKIVDNLKAVLSDTYATIVQEELRDEDVQIEVIIGKKK